jgi:hypothetical protein
MPVQEENIRKRIETIIKCLAPIKDISFPLAVKILTDFDVLAFDPLTNDNQQLLMRLSSAAQLAGQHAFEKGIEAKRPNEAGRKIERLVLDALNQVRLRVETPLSKAGTKKTSGYPDIQVHDENGQTIYIDCKTYDTSTKNQNYRTFYLSPSEYPKVTRDALHFLMSFELNKVQRKSKKVFIPVSWQIYSLESLLIKLKLEFNASNRDFYLNTVPLIEGSVNNIKLN